MTGILFDAALQKMPEIHKALSQKVMKDIFLGKIHRKIAEKIVTKILRVIKNHK